MTESEKETKRLLTAAERRLSGAIASFLLVAAAWLYFGPPYRTSTVEDSNGTNTVTTASAEPSTLVIAVFTAAVALAVYGINGRRLTSFSAGNVQVSSEDPPSTPRESEGGTPPAAPKPAAAVAVEAANAQAAVEAYFRRWLDAFFRLASWNGKKAMYACALASKTEKALDLRGLCKADARMSFDYAYGYIIAASSAGVFTQQSAPEVLSMVVRGFDPAFLEMLVIHIKGHLPNPPDDRQKKIEEIKFISAWFDVPPPPFPA